MKGTIERGVNPSVDNRNIDFLKNDVKNKAENVMIVDLLRNDLGKIAKTGTILSMKWQHNLFKNGYNSSIIYISCLTKSCMKS